MEGLVFFAIVVIGRIVLAAIAASNRKQKTQNQRLVHVPPRNQRGGQQRGGQQRGQPRRQPRARPSAPVRPDAQGRPAYGSQGRQARPGQAARGRPNPARAEDLLAMARGLDRGQGASQNQPGRRQQPQALGRGRSQDSRTQQNRPGQRQQPQALGGGQRQRPQGLDRRVRAQLDEWNAGREVIGPQLEELKPKLALHFDTPAFEPLTHHLDEWWVDDKKAFRHLEAEWKKTRPIGPQVRQRLERLRGHERVIGFMQKVAEQRENGSLHDLLNDLDRYAVELYKPIVAFAAGANMTLSTQLPIAWIDNGQRAGRMFDAYMLAPVEVPARVAVDPVRWPLVGREIAIDLLFSVQGLHREVVSFFGFADPVQPRAISGRSLSSAVARAPMGAWVDQMVVDLTATMLAGPAYLAMLVELLQKPGQRNQTVTIGAQNGRFTRAMPAHLRIYACYELLGQMNLHYWADPVWERWKKLHGDPQIVFYPHQNRYLQLPLSFYMGQLKEQLERFWTHSFDALGGVELRSVPGLSWSVATTGQMREAREALREGKPARNRSPRAMVAAAVMVAAKLPMEQRHRVVALLRDSLLSKRERRSSWGGAQQGRSGSGLGGLIGGGGLREALVLREVLTRRHGSAPLRLPGRL